MSAQGSIDIEVDDFVAVVTINRPGKHNTLTLDMVFDLHRATATLQADESVRAVVVTGAGEKAFSAGGDLHSLLPAALEARTDILNPIPTERFFSALFKPVVAAVEGICVGGGFEIMLGSDIRVASERATFAVPEGRWGLIPGSGTNVRLPQQIPWAIAMELLLLGDTITAQRAHEVGLINRIVAPGAARAAAVEIARRAAANGPLAVQTSKEIAVRSAGLADGFVLEHALNGRILGSNDAREGVCSFEEKRAAHFTGR